MAETENKYVKPITKEKKQAIVDASVQSMNKRPTSDETAMKKRFVQPIVNLDNTPCLADEVDRVANEANDAIEGLDSRTTQNEVDIPLILLEYKDSFPTTIYTYQYYQDKIANGTTHLVVTKSFNRKPRVGDVYTKVIKTSDGYVCWLKSEIAAKPGPGNVVSTKYIDIEELYSPEELNSLKHDFYSLSLYEIVQSLPHLGEANKLYLLPAESTEDVNIFEEWLWVNGAWEMVGTMKAETIENLKNGKGKGAIEQIADGVADGFAYAEYNADGSVKSYKNPTVMEWISDDLKAYIDGGGKIPYGAEGNFSSAIGGKSYAYGKRSHAQGTTTVALGDYSHVEGNNSATLGANSHAEGKQTTTLGENAHAEGFDTFAEGYISHSEGYKTHAQGACSHAEGNGTEALQDQAHAEGSQTHAKGYASHTEGEGTFAENHACHAEGKDSHANGYCSHSEGISTYANGMYSHSQGGWCYANGDYSFAGGNNSIADYLCDFVYGEGLRVTYEHQTVFGKYNDASYWGDNKPLFMIGNGKSASERSNAFEVRENGDVYAGGKRLLREGEGVVWKRIQGGMASFHKLDLDGLADGLYRVNIYTNNLESVYLSSSFGNGIGASSCIAIISKQSGKFTAINVTYFDAATVRTRINPLSNVEQLGLYTYDAVQNLDAYYSIEKIEV